MRDLGTSLREYVEGIAPPVTIDDVRARRPAQRRRRRARLLVAAVVLLALGVVAALAAGAGREPDRAPADTGAADRPPALVVWGQQGPLVLDGDDLEVRARVGDIDDAGTWSSSPPDFAATPDGGALYWETTFPTSPGADPCPGSELARSDLAGSVLDAVPVVDGRDPAVSPDGRWLAYVRTVDCDARAVAVIVRELTSGAEREWRVGRDADPAGSSALSWAPDSRHLAFQVGSLHGANTDPQVLDTGSEGFASLRPVAIPDGTRYAGHLGASGELLGWRAAGLGEGRDHEVVALDPETGAITRTLFEVPGAVTDLAADATGRHVLAVVGAAGDLYRWTEGEEAPVRLLTQVEAAAWLPAIVEDHR